MNENICEKCKNKDVCKWIETYTSIQTFNNSLDINAPLKLGVTCEKRRVENA